MNFQSVGSSEFLNEFSHYIPLASSRREKLSENNGHMFQALSKTSKTHLTLQDYVILVGHCRHDVAIYSYVGTPRI